jgi:microcystin-dependent protein
MIIQVGFSFAPVGWQTCSGQTLSISQNTALFSLLGTTYGGNGTTTFLLPDLRSRVAIGAGQGPGLSNYVQGQAAGVENVTILQSNMPTHSHTLNVSSTKATLQLAATGSTLGHTKDGAPTPVALPEIYCPAGTATNIPLAPSSIGFSGSGLPINILPPYLAILNIIALVGIFPSRS